MEMGKPLEKVLCMNGGNGDSSYAYYSPSVQLKMVLACKRFLEHAISHNVRPAMAAGEVARAFRIADFGCATGFNTLLTVDTIVRSVKLAFIRHSMDVPEFQVYFCDLQSNDFNTLVRTLPPCVTGDMSDGDEKTAAATYEDKAPAIRSYFAAAVTGSHYRRLFPRQTLHFCHSSISLHWLSQVPASVEDRNSPAWNGGHIYISRDVVGNAYLDQFRRDFADFLAARAEEIVHGGCMFIAVLGRNSPDVMEQSGLGACAHHLEAAFQDLVDKGLVGEEKLDSFNMPFYGPSAEELQSIVETEKSFEIESVRVLSGFHLHPLLEVKEGEEEMFGRIVAKHYRALFESVVGGHLGCDEYLVNQFFSSIAKRAAAKYREYLTNTLDLVVAFLVRN